jgi:tetratricopeptide (TPR) repeat protein
MNRLSLLLPLLLSASALAQEKKPDPKAEARKLLEEAKSKRGSEAIELCDKAIKLDPMLSGAFVHRGVQRRIDEPLVALADFARAEACVSGEFPSEAVFWRAVTLMDGLLDRSSALAEVERLRSRGGGVWAHMGYGLKGVLLYRFEEAEGYFDKVANADPRTPLVYRYLALVRFELTPAVAPEAAQKAVAADNEDPSVAALKAMVDGLNDSVGAVKTLDGIVAAHPNLAWARLARARLLEKEGKFDEALAALDELEKARPSTSEAAYRRGRVLRGLKKHSESAAAFTRALAFDPEFGEAMMARSEAYFDAKEWTSVIRDCDTLSKMSLADRDLEAVRQRREKAVTMLDRDKPRFSVSALVQRAGQYLNEGDFDRAEKDLEQAEEIDPKDGRVHIGWMQFWTKKGDIEKLFDAVQKAIDAGQPGFAIVSQGALQPGSPDNPFTPMQKHARFNELRDKLKLNSLSDFNARGIHRSMQAQGLAARPSDQKEVYKLALEDFQQIIDRFGSDNESAQLGHYNACCVYSLMGDLEPAFASLRKSIDAGYGAEDQAYQHILKNDTDLANMRADGRWAEAVKYLKDKTGRK